MPVNKDSYQQIRTELGKHVTLVAVSKTKPVAEIQNLYELGHLDFGENYVQELVEKQRQLPSDLHWHFIGHLQTNKVKLIASFIHLIHSVDSLKLLKEINKQAATNQRLISVLLQVHIATEESKFGLDAAELKVLLSSNEVKELDNIIIEGLMGMASFSKDIGVIRKEFQTLRSHFDTLKSFAATSPNIQPRLLSMGMSSDYRIAIEEGSNMVRIGNLLFGERI